MSNVNNSLRRSSRIQNQVSLQTNGDLMIAATQTDSNPSPDTDVVEISDTEDNEAQPSTPPRRYISNGLTEESRLTEDGATGGGDETRGSTLDCAICLQPCVHPAKLPCSHIFCFLCLKGFAQQSRRCAMCRTPIPHDYLDRPELVQLPEPSSLDNGYQWFYEGRNGWWQYDDRTSQDLEANYQNGERQFELLIAGNIYQIDFNDMVQFRTADPMKIRRIKRDMWPNASRIKGIAGLRLGVVPSDPPPATLPQDLPDHTSTDHNYSLVPAIPPRRARILATNIPDATGWVDSVVSNIDDSSRHDHLYTRREAFGVELPDRRDTHLIDPVEGSRHDSRLQRRIDLIEGQRQSVDARLQRRIDSIEGHLHVIYMRRDGQTTDRNRDTEQQVSRSRARENIVDPARFHSLNLYGDREYPTDLEESRFTQNNRLAEVNRNLDRNEQEIATPTGSARFHSLVRQASALSELFHRLRCAMRQVRHIVTDLRNRFLPWRISARMSRRLELASLVRRLFVALDMNVLYRLFLEFSRVLQESLRRRECGPRQNEFLAQLNNEALDKARVCTCHSGRGPQEYVRRAQEILYGLGTTSQGGQQVENTLGDHLQQLGNSTGDNPQQIDNYSENNPENLVPDSTTSQPPSQSNALESYSSLADILNQMLAEERPVRPLLTELETIRRLLSTTLIRIREERTNESPMEREEENYFLSQDTWAGLSRVVHMVVEMCGGEIVTASEGTRHVNEGNVTRPGTSEPTSGVNNVQIVEPGTGDSQTALNDIHATPHGSIGSSYASVNASLTSNTEMLEGPFSTYGTLPTPLLEYPLSRNSNPFHSRTISTATDPDNRRRHLYANCSPNCTCPTCAYVEESASNLRYLPFSNANPSYGTVAEPAYANVDPSYGNVDLGYGDITDASCGNVGPTYPNLVDASYINAESQYGNIDPFYGSADSPYGNLVENSYDSHVDPSHSSIVDCTYGSASECSTTDATHSAYGASFSVNTECSNAASETTWSNDCDSDRTSTAVTTGAEWEDYEGDMSNRYHVCNNMAGHNGIRCWLYGCYDRQTNRQTDENEPNVTRESNGFTCDGERSQCDRGTVENPHVSTNQDGNVTYMMNQMYLGSTANPICQCSQPNSRSLSLVSLPQEIDEPNALDVSHSNLENENSEERTCEKASSLMQTCDIANQRIDESSNQDINSGMSSDEASSECIADQNVSHELSNVRFSDCLVLDANNDLNGLEVGIPPDHQYTTVGFEPAQLVRRREMDSANICQTSSQDSSMNCDDELSVRNNQLDTRRRKISASKSYEHCSSSDQSITNRYSRGQNTSSQESFRRIQDTFNRSQDSSSHDQSTSSSSPSGNYFDYTEINSSQGNNTTHHSLSDANADFDDHNVPYEGKHPISGMECQQKYDDVPTNVGNTVENDHRYSEAVQKGRDASTASRGTCQETEHSCSSKGTNGSDRPHCSSSSSNPDSCGLQQYSSASDILRDFGFDILNRTKLSYNAKEFVPRARSDETSNRTDETSNRTDETSCIGENPSRNCTDERRGDGNNAMNANQADIINTIDSNHFQIDGSSTDSRQIDESNSINRNDNFKNNTTSRRICDDSLDEGQFESDQSMTESQFDSNMSESQVHSSSTSQFDGSSSSTSQFDSSSTNESQFDSNHSERSRLDSNQSRTERTEDSNHSVSESPSNCMNPTVNEHNYAAVTTKHQSLTRQDSEHSYACKKLKSSRKNSSGENGNYRSKKSSRTNPSGDLEHYSKLNRSSSSSDGNCTDGKLSSDISGGGNENLSKSNRSSSGENENYKDTVPAKTSGEIKSENCDGSQRNTDGKSKTSAVSREIKSESCDVNTEHAYSKHSVSVALFDHEYAKVRSESSLVDRMNHLTLRESDDEEDEDL